ncbi:collagen alpha-2(I) chain-like [Sorex araneus]|uniref:collagen alpha-2(I) chain-like n=1 Tax=Sorex araneus TaxID=42254 RepID=UPI00243372E6|nr:collagen alpha-2(I) chain-like [Sorex araneus]XP_054980369.1 collagen alpha-2(I) chain-like [Sorex araneus]
MLPALRPHPVGAPGPWCCSREARRTVHPGLGGGAEMGGGEAGRTVVGGNREREERGAEKQDREAGVGGEEPVRGRQGRGMQTPETGAADGVGGGRRGGLGEGGKLMGLAVRGIRRGAGRMLGMEIRAPAGEEGGKQKGVGTHGAGGWEGRSVRSGRGVRGARRGSAGSGCALCPGAPLTLRRRRPPAPFPGLPPNLLSTSAAVCEGGAKPRTGSPSQIPGWISGNGDWPPPTTAPPPRAPHCQGAPRLRAAVRDPGRGDVRGPPAGSAEQARGRCPFWSTPGGNRKTLESLSQDLCSPPGTWARFLPKDQLACPPSAPTAPTKYAEQAPT